MLESLSNDIDIGTRCFKPEPIEKCKETNNLAIANEKWPVVAFDDESYVHMSVFTSKVHHDAKLRCFVVTYNKIDKALDCGCCTRKIMCVHKAMSIWFLEQIHVIIHPVCYDETKNENEKCNTGYTPINEAILLEMIVFMRDQKLYKREAVKYHNKFKKEIFPRNLTPLQEKCHLRNATISNPIKVSEKCFVVTFHGVFKDYISSVKQCLFCGHFYRYPTCIHGIHNYDDRFFVGIDVCLFLREHIQNHSSESSFLKSHNTLFN